MTSSLVFVALFVFINFVSCMGRGNETHGVNVNVNINVNSEETLRQEIAQLTERLSTVEDRLSGEIICLRALKSGFRPLIKGYIFGINIQQQQNLCRNGFFQCLAFCLFFSLVCSGQADTLFLATIGAVTVTPVSDPIVFDEVRLNPGGHYDSSTGIYTAPVDGYYEFNINVRSSPDQDFGSFLYRDGVKVAHSRNADFGGPGVMTTLLVIPVHATAGQQFWAGSWSLNAIQGRVESDGELNSWFSGCLLFAD